MSEKKSTVAKESKIDIAVGLNEENVPVKISWKADDNPEAKNWQDSKAMILSFFDSESKDTLRIDLWTTELQIMEMDRLVYHTLKGLTDSYFKATGNQELAQQMHQFAQYFGEKTEILPPKEKKAD